MRVTPSSVASTAALLLLYGGTKAMLYRRPLAVGESVISSEQTTSGVQGELKAALHGRRVWVINFFETWCGPCKVELPAVERLFAERKAEGLGVVGVYGASSAADIDAFRQSMTLSFPLVYDKDGELARQYHVDGVPNTFITDAKGQLLYHLRGLDTELADKVRQALDQAEVRP